ncbi:hypothetical protein KCU83_g46, partial [Aureobasidium melanogenum]
MVSTVASVQAVLLTAAARRSDGCNAWGLKRVYVRRCLEHNDAQSTMQHEPEASYIGRFQALPIVQYTEMYA